MIVSTFSKYLLVYADSGGGDYKVIWKRLMNHPIMGVACLDVDQVCAAEPLPCDTVRGDTTLWM